MQREAFINVQFHWPKNDSISVYIERVRRVIIVRRQKLPPRPPHLPRRPIPRSRLGEAGDFLVVVTMLTADPLAWAGPVPFITALGVGAVLTWVIKKYSAKEAVAHPLSFGAYIAWSLVSSLFLTPLALCTMDSADWGTRSKPQEVPLGNTNR
jgi:hypothetical protein